MRAIKCRADIGRYGAFARLNESRQFILTTVLAQTRRKFYGVLSRLVSLDGYNPAVCAAEQLVVLGHIASRSLINDSILGIRPLRYSTCSLAACLPAYLTDKVLPILAIAGL